MQRYTGTLTKIKQTETLLIWDKEVQRIGFTVQQTDGTLQEMAAVSDEGTAYYFLEYDNRFRTGTEVRCYKEAGLCVGIALVSDDDREPITDIERLKDKAQDNLFLKAAELHALFHAFPADSPQAYAIAVQLKRQHRDRTYPIAERDAVCSTCRSELQVSERHAYRFGKTRCDTCGKNVDFDLVQPIPREPSEPPPSLDEIQAKLREKFGNRR